MLSKSLKNGPSPRALLLSRHFASRARPANAPSMVSMTSNKKESMDESLNKLGFLQQEGDKKLDLGDFLRMASAEDANLQESKLPVKIQEFLSDIKQFNKMYKKGGTQGEGFVGIDQLNAALKVQEPERARYYSAKDLAELNQAAAEVQNRMRVKVSAAYLDHCCKVPANATKPHPALKVVLPEAQEVTDMAGEVDPSNQNTYSPLPGLLHKYEMILVYSAINCSSHCRYCYRSDLFNGISEKSKADMMKVYEYVSTYNTQIKELTQSHGEMDEYSGLWVHKETRENLIPIREALLSGGDPLTLPNSTIGRYFAMLADAGVKQIRLGTKEFVFSPDRFDSNFFGMLDTFHEAYPDVHVAMVGHYLHPFELLDAKTNEAGDYTYDINEKYEVRSDLVEPLRQINQRTGWLSHYNQFPIVAGINDDAAVIRLILLSCARMGIGIHNIYACREIIGNAHFRQGNDIARQYALVETAKLGLSGLQNHARLIMSTEYGKTEVVGADREKLHLRLNRFIHGFRSNDISGGMTIDLAKLGGPFFWLTDDVIKSGAVCDKGVALVESLRGMQTSNVKLIKDKCGVMATSSQAGQQTAPAPAAASAGPVEITISSPVDRTLTVDLAKEAKGVTLAHVLAREGVVEAACKCSLSCSSCVGWTWASSKLPTATEDELDVVELHEADENEGTGSLALRATCQVPLQAGVHYTFSPPAQSTV